MKPKIIGHRGFSALYPENTMLSFKKAIEYGADGVELDVRCTKDAKVIVIHDESIDRVSDGKGFVREMNYSEILEYDFGMGQKIPLLETVLDEIPSGKLINIEIKEMEVLEVLYDLIKIKSNRIPDLMFSSFLHDSLTAMKKRLPDVKRGILIGEEAKNVPDLISYAAEKAYKIHPFSFNLPISMFDFFEYNEAKKSLLKITENGISIMWWTVKKDTYEKKLFDEGIGQYYITNDVNGFVEEFRDYGD